MTTVRKWGVRYRDAFQNCIWRGPNRQPDTADLDKAYLWNSDSHIEAAWVARETGGTVREVLVTQEAGGWEMEGPVHVVSSTPRACVVHSGGDFLGQDGRLTGDRERAMIFPDSRSAFDAALRVHDSATGVYLIRRTESREVRRAGRTLDEILASVPVEVK